MQTNVRVNCVAITVKRYNLRHQQRPIIEAVSAQSEWTSTCLPHTHGTLQKGWLEWTRQNAQRDESWEVEICVYPSGS